LRSLQIVIRFCIRVGAGTGSGARRSRHRTWSRIHSQLKEERHICIPFIRFTQFTFFILYIYCTVVFFIPVSFTSPSFNFLFNLRPFTCCNSILFLFNFCHYLFTYFLSLHLFKFLTFLRLLPLFQSILQFFLSILTLLGLLSCFFPLLFAYISQQDPYCIPSWPLLLPYPTWAHSIFSIYFLGLGEMFHIRPTVPLPPFQGP
jgi:hypothetical protein